MYILPKIIFRFLKYLSEYQGLLKTGMFNTMCNFYRLMKDSKWPILRKMIKARNVTFPYFKRNDTERKTDI